MGAEGQNKKGANAPLRKLSKTKKTGFYFVPPLRVSKGETVFGAMNYKER